VRVIKNTDQRHHSAPQPLDIRVGFRNPEKPYVGTIADQISNGPQQPTFRRSYLYPDENCNPLYGRVANRYCTALRL
jgi:hypothetical protein